MSLPVTLAQKLRECRKTCKRIQARLDAHEAAFRSRKVAPAAPGIGSVLRAYRLQETLTLTQLAERTGFMPSAICRLEAGEFKNPRIKTLRVFAKEMGISVEELVARIEASESLNVQT